MAVGGPDFESHANQAAFEQLRQRFRAGLLTRTQQLQGTTDPAEQARLLHSLAGAAGCYGLVVLETVTRRALASVLSGSCTQDERAELLHQVFVLMEQERGGCAAPPSQLPQS